jgi:glycosyltransferase involved in cell wall biosynthesis
VKPCLFIAGLAQNCSNQLLSNIPSLLGLGKNFDCTGVVLENGSADNTRQVAEAFTSKLNNGKVITPEIPSGLSRYEKMAFLRNELLSEASKVKPDFVCMVDLDLYYFDGLEEYIPSSSMVADTTFGLMPHPLVSSWHPSEKITWMGFDWVYYDLLAVEYLDGTRPNWQGDILYPDTKDEFKKSELSSVTMGMDVSSAYGGMAFYLYDAIKDIRYDGSDCEHIKFNKQLKGVKIIETVRGLYYPPVRLILAPDTPKNAPECT